MKILRYPESGVADVVRHGAEVDHLRVPEAPLVQSEQEVGVAVVLEYADLKIKTQCVECIEDTFSFHQHGLAFSHFSID